ncbi:type II toxin-antitoxin system VapC family toxin [Pseudomonas nitroreducens]|uniref:type II toxin-antitoxin system VapC family toxin n=1 Tax=Pseudomonas nitroreducens TaxID=46680 RepID=UPI00209EE8E5|nr:type II toxin-antitoxin system VapC family toxin [Pseudomonas nitroreducens]MCP1625638.1 PIN domain nuclease of toxin-antitoxin system [Pseudomonas nitroreducens]
MILLDTHILIWAATDDPRLTPKARQMIESALDNGQPVHFSAISLAEIAIKASLAKKSLGVEPDELRRASLEGGLRELPFVGAHAVALRALPQHEDHKDPHDRMLVAQAQVEGLQLVTADAKLERYGSAVLYLKSR